MIPLVNGVWERGVRALDLEAAFFPRGARLLVVGALVLVGIAAVSHTVWLLTGFTDEFWFQLWYLFDVGREHNIPTWYASFLWATLGALGVLGAALTQRRAGWLVLAVVAFAASIDEYAELHERLDSVGAPLAASLGLDVWFTWVLPAIAIVVLVVVALIPLLRALPPAQLWLLVLGGVLFVGGALGVETLSGLVLLASGGEVNRVYVYVTMVEELLELVGVAVAIGAVAALYSWRARDGRLAVTFRGWRPGDEVRVRPT